MTEEVVAGTSDGTSDEAAARAEAVRRNVRLILDGVESSLVGVVSLAVDCLTAASDGSPQAVGVAVAVVTAVAGALIWIVCSCCFSAKSDKSGDSDELDARVASSVGGVNGDADTGATTDDMNRSFRKRDKIAFMGRKVYKNAKAVGGFIRGGKGQKRKMAAKLIRKVFHQDSPTGSVRGEDLTLGRSELPEAYLEVDYEDNEGDECWAEALTAMTRSLRIFGLFDQSLLIEIIRGAEQQTVKNNQYLFRVGDPDDSMYIVESGRLNLYSTSQLEGGSPTLLKSVGPGDPILSLLSFMVHLHGQKQENFRTVSAKAMEETKIIKFRFSSFKQAFEKHPDQLYRVVQVVMVRLQRVTLLALHQYLGLGAELLNQADRGNISRSSFSNSPAGVGAGGSHEVTTLATTQSSEIYKEAEPDIEEMDRSQLRTLAVDIYKEILGLNEDDMALLEEDRLDIRDDRYLNVNMWEEGDTLIEEDTSDDPGLFLVLKGVVSMSQINSDGGEAGGGPTTVEIHRSHGGGCFGQLQVLTDEPSFFTVKVVKPEAPHRETVVAKLEADFIRACMERLPKVAVTLANLVIEQLSPYVRSIDFSLEWIQLKSGKALYKQGQIADSTYVVLAGRLRSVIKKGEKRTLVGEYARGDLAGIVETLMKNERSTTVMAVRDTEVAKIPAGLIDVVSVRFPIVLKRLIKLLGQKVQQSWTKDSGPDISGAAAAAAVDGMPGQSAGQMQSNFSTVAILGVDSSGGDNPSGRPLPVDAFTFELLHALQPIDPAKRLTREHVLTSVGPEAFEKANEFRLTEWLTSQEDKHRIIIYQCDSKLTDWTRLCIRHADVVFVLVDPHSGNSPALTQLEKSIEDMSQRTRKDMVFLHDEETAYPKGSVAWLKERPWIHTHYHVKCSKRMFSKKTKYSRILSEGPPPNVHSDFSRLARALTGQSVGLVLGGGGARGCSHIGMIKAIMEAGIPIDQVAGVSIGSFIGGLYSRERNLTEVTVKAREFCFKMGQIYRWLLDLNFWPATSWFNGWGFNQILESIFGPDSDIRDNWLPFFTVTADITDSQMRIHDYGSLWRYVRGSMSLANWLPPICDPVDGHLLLDGGYVNNLPADVMRQRGAKHILAVDVGSEDTNNFTQYGDYLSGYRMLISWLPRWFPFVKHVVVPGGAEIQLRLAYVSCIDKLESVKNSGYCEYIRPPIEKYGTLQFQDFEEIKDVGYRHGETYFKGFKKAGLMRQFYWSNPNMGNRRRGSLFSLGAAMRRGSIDNLATSADSDGGLPSVGGSLGSNGSPARISLAEMMKQLNSTQGSDLARRPSAPRRRSSAVLSGAAAAAANSQIQVQSTEDEDDSDEENTEDDSMINKQSPSGGAGGPQSRRRAALLSMPSNVSSDPDDDEGDAGDDSVIAPAGGGLAGISPAEDEVDHDVDTDDLISNEEDDNESGFLSQL